MNIRYLHIEDTESDAWLIKRSLEKEGWAVEAQVISKLSELQAHLDSQWDVMKRHPGLAYDLLSPISFLSESLEIPYSHHEKWDGSGYPQGLKGESIPLSARLFSIVDVWDAMRSDRPYRPGLSWESTLEHIQKASGTQFDPKVVRYFLELMKPGDQEFRVIK